MYTKDGKRYVSNECEPRGEAHENIGIEWLSDKFRRITSAVLTADTQEKILALVTQDTTLPFRNIIDLIVKACHNSAN